jgi:hypothetical protein
MKRSLGRWIAHGLLAAAAVAATVGVWWIALAVYRAGPPASAPGAVSARLKAAKGGTVGDRAAASVEVPAGALAADADVSVRPQDAGAFHEDGKQVVGKVWSFRVDAHDHYDFQTQVTLRVPYDPAQLPEGADEQALTLAVWDGGKWQAVPGAVIDSVAHQAVADVWHFSDYGVLQDMSEGAPDDRSVPDVPNPKGKYKTEWVWILSQYDARLDNLARAVTRKYAERLGIRDGLYLEPAEWLKDGQTVKLTDARRAVSGGG